MRIFLRSFQHHYQACVIYGASAFSTFNSLADLAISFASGTATKQRLRIPPSVIQFCTCLRCGSILKHIISALEGVFLNPKVLLPCNSPNCLSCITLSEVVNYFCPILYGFIIITKANMPFCVMCNPTPLLFCNL